ncbi:hypothetical protein BDL97_17G009300 [Sphagnum fallax]|nr:hypothetical protein BDL97_17G009300 [Sphagnum fallax]
MRRWNWTVRSAIVAVVVLAATLLVSDYYKWRLLALPWYSDTSQLDSFHGEILQHRKSSGGNPTTGQHLSVPLSQAGLANAASINVSVKSPQATVASRTPGSSPIVTTALPPLLSPVAKSPQPKLSSLQLLEKSLSKARLAIRNVIVSGIKVAAAEPATDGSDELFGDVYRNAAVFRQSYWEMENRLKIFVYEEGEEPLVHNGPCKEIYAVEGRFIQELQGDNPFLTTNPEHAHVFFMPFSVAMMVTYLYEAESQDINPLRNFVQDYINAITQTYPYWNRSVGADHFMISCHDWGPEITRSHPDLATKSIRVLCNANSSEGHVPYKDASLPEINLVGGNIPTELGGPPAHERPYLAFFAGGDHGPVRPHLFEYWKEKDKDVRVYQELPAGLNYQQLMKESRYCLCPGGYEVNSPRIVEAIYNNCVPVVIADGFVLPFSDVLNWSMFSLHINESDIPMIKQILQAIPMDTYISMQVTTNLFISITLLHSE